MKKRIFGIGFVALAVLLAVGFTSCSNSSNGDGGGPEPPQSGATLNWVTIGTVTPAEPEDAGTLAEVLDSDYMSGYEETIDLTAAQASASIRYELGSGSEKATVKFARIEKAIWEDASFDPEDNDAIEADLTTAVDGRTFVDEDWLVIKVTSEDGTATKYYRTLVTLGRNSYLQSVTIGSTARIGDGNLGKPADDFANFDFARNPAAGKGTKGTFQTDPLTDASKFILRPEDEGAAVSYAILQEAGNPTGLPGSFTAITDFVDGIMVSSLGFDEELAYNLYVKIVPTSPLGITRYYIMSVVFGRGGQIAYGVPKLVDPGNPGNPFYIDPIWDDVDWDFEIDRANSAERSALSNYFFDTNGQHTVARAKALWDDGGIWVLVDADVKRFSKSGGTPDTDRPITPGADHLADSLEVFINERYQRLGESSNNDWGNQFRVGVNNARTGETAGATTQADQDKGWAADAKPTLAPFNEATYAKTRTALKDGLGVPGEVGSSANFVGDLEDATNGGYMVLAYVPFKFQASANASNVWANNSIKEGAVIGFELQLNCNSGGGRDGIITWNGVNQIAYQNARGYGLVTLTRERGGSTKPVDNTVFPTISAQALSEKEYLFEAVATPLSVTTTGTIQWFSSATQFGAGTPLAGQTASTFTPPTDVAGTTYYYAVVTAGGVSVVTDRRAKIKVFAEGEAPVDDLPIPAYETVTLNNNAYALYKFELPAGAKWSEYTAIKVDYRISAATKLLDIRSSRVYGSYEASDFNTVASGKRRIGFDNGYIFADKGVSWTAGWDTLADGGSVTADEWFTVTYALDGTGITDTTWRQHVPGPNDIGPFYFGLGVPGTDGNATTIDIRNATLVHTDSAKNAVSTGSGFAEPAFIAYADADCTRVINND